MPSVAVTQSSDCYAHPARRRIAAIIGVSVVASAFICWLVYVHPPVDAAGTRFNFLPASTPSSMPLPPSRSSPATASSVPAWWRSHRNAMFTAFIFSSAFLVSYLATYYLHGETRLPIAHTGAALVHLRHRPVCDAYPAGHRRPADDPDHVLPLALRPLPRSTASIARWTYPIWLYVSVSGVFVYFLQAVVRR